MNKMIDRNETKDGKATMPTKLPNFVACLISLLTFSIISVSLAPSAFAQFASPLLPCPGNGSIPKPEISGDVLPSNPVATGTAISIPTSGTPLLHFVNRGRTTIYVYSICKRGEDDSMAGKRLVLAFRPSSLKSKAVAEIGNILGVDLNSGESTIQADATAHQLELIQAVLNRSPNDLDLGLATMSPNETKQINKAATAEQWSKLRKPGDDSLNINSGVLPTARVCARYFVTVAIAFSTVFLIFASTAIIFGEAHGAPRVIATCGGLMLLLMGYSIYKVAVINLFNADTTLKQNVDTIRHLSNQGQIPLGNR